ncbi:MAG: DUF488 domain-containing protein [Actinomycetota bacterium]|nr:DUF488 domain-containing protein [Actinomycetota bacterium]
MTVYTIGHSTREHAELFAMLRRSRVTLLCDIRSYPSSRFCPQWNRQAIIDALPADIGYTHLPRLGGKRQARPASESSNGGWRNAAFRGYADYMQTAAFQAGLAELLELMARQTVAIMCAEAVPWRCHRSLVTDALIARGVQVCDILSMTATRPAVIHAFAHVQDQHVSYPPAAPGASLG